MEIDRGLLYDRLQELSWELDTMDFEDEHLTDMTNEFVDLSFIRDMFYLADEGFIEIDDDGRMFPIGEAVSLHLP